MITKVIKFDINKNLYNTLIAKQGDTKSRFLLFNLLDGSIPFSLENRSVRVYVVKPDRTEVFNDLIITDAAKGYCILELTTQMLAVAGTVRLELMVIEEDKKLTSNIFYMDVKESINSEKAVVSTNEFTALMNGLAALSEYDIYKSNAKQVPGIKEEVSNLSSQLDKTVRFKKIEEEKMIVKEGNSIQLYTDEERVIESYPITSPDRVIYKNGISVEEKLRNVFIQSTMPALVEEGDIWKEVLEDGKVRERVYNGGGTGTEVDYDVLHYETSEDLIVGQVENLAETGYKKLPGGLILQWGRV